MIVEGYTAHLYCDRDYDSLNSEFRIGHPHGLATNPWEVTGYNKADVHRQIKNAGWVIHKDGRVSCRKCLAEKRPFKIE